MVTKKSSKKAKVKLTSSKATESTESSCCGSSMCSCSSKWACDWGSKSSGSGIYFLGFIGALIYYVSTTSGFWNTVLAILKAMVWPAMLVFKLLGM